MNRALAALQRAAGRLGERLEELEPRLTAGENVWPAYLETLHALAAITPLANPQAGGWMLTTQQLADSMQLSPRTILRRAKKGELEPLRLGRRGRGALRW